MSRLRSVAWAVVLVVALLAAPSGAARADDAPQTPRYPTLEAVDCVSATACMAVGTHVDVVDRPLAEAWDGRSWHELRFPTVPQSGAPRYLAGHLDEVSCTSKASGVGLAGIYCVAIGHYYQPGDGPMGDISYDEGALTAVWNGAVWRIASTPAYCSLPGECTSRSQVDCTSVRHCYATGTTGQSDENGFVRYFWTWNGSTWSGVRVPDAYGGGLSCWADAQCVIVGGRCADHTTSAGQCVYQSYFQQAVMWISGSRRTFYDGGRTAPAAGYLSRVSCTDASYCVAQDDDYSIAFTPHGVDYHHMRRPDDYTTTALSCSRRAACLTVGYGGSADSSRYVRVAERYTGRHWTITPRPGRPVPVGSTPSVDLQHDVSCARPTLCFTTGRLYSTATDNPTGAVQAEPGDVPGAGLLARWDGHHWTDEPVEVGTPSYARGATTDPATRPWVQHGPPVVSRKSSSDDIASDPSVVVDHGTYRMVYSGPSRHHTRSSLIEATSRDGVHWRDVGFHDGVVLEGTPGRWDAFIETSNLLHVGGRYLLFYAGYPSEDTGTSPVTHGQLGLATSTDAVHFTRVSSHPVMPTTPGGLDEEAIFSPTIVKVHHTLWMLYTGWRGQGGQLLGARSTDLGRSWTKITSGPVFGPSSSHPYMDNSTDEAAVVRAPGGGYDLYFTAGSLESVPMDSIGVAHSARTPFGPWTLAARPVVTEDPTGSGSRRTSASRPCCTATASGRCGSPASASTPRPGSARCPSPCSRSATPTPAEPTAEPTARLSGAATGEAVTSTPGERHP